MEAEIISSEYIKPSSPTPHDRKIHNMSLLDQISPAFFVPTIFYYPNLENKPKSPDFISVTTQILKQSLSETLTHFYPLAGRTTDTGLSIDCNDEGVLFVVAKFETDLSEFLESPDLKACWAHVPGPITWTDPGPGAEVIMFQVSYFDCGGIVIGLLFHHRVGDGSTLGTFMKRWAANALDHHAQGCGEMTIMPPPDFTLPSVFPHNLAMPKESFLNTVMERYLKFGRNVVRHYVFDALAISKVRAKVAQQVGPRQRPPSRVEIVTALMWKYFMIASSKIDNDNDDDSVDDNELTSLVSHVLNMRRKGDPPFQDGSFGNFLWVVPASITFTSADQFDADLENALIGKVRSAFSMVDVDFVKRMRDDHDGFSGYCKNKEDSWSRFPETGDYLSMVSWCNFGFYNIDFGWGRPVWITRCDADSDTEGLGLNMLWMIDTRNGDGVEAWLKVDESYVDGFDSIEELRELASIDPSPLDFI